MFTSNNTDSQASNPETALGLELTEQELEQVSGGILPAIGRFIGGQLFNQGSRAISGVVRDLNNNSDIYRNLR